MDSPYPARVMTPEQLNRLRPLFLQALDLPETERSSFLDKACGGDPELRAELGALLQADRVVQDDGFMETSASNLISSLPPQPSLEGQRVGAYTVLRPLGHGGMGDVYLALRKAPYKQYVALKIIRPGLDSRDILQRFEMERQILASLTHPHIAQLRDGGTTDDGRPYFVMEYVEGTSITDYCDTRLLPIPARLRLFESVCRAVHYAHQNLVVHRDLKPSNILVTEAGTVKLLDFGVAKLLNPHFSHLAVPITRTMYRMMTPEYASPEQIRGETLTTASDIYALGILLYELLTGNRPYRFNTSSASEIERIVCEQDPERPSTIVTKAIQRRYTDASTQTITPELASEVRSITPERLRRRLRGDLDNIVMMAMRKEPQRRYSSAEQLAEDIGRHLAGAPVRARKPTVAYRTHKFIQRHRAGVVTTTGLLLLLIAVGLLYAVRVTMERNRAQQAAAQAEQVTDFMINVFQGSDPYKAAGDTITARDLLDRGVQRIEQELSDQPLVQARMMDAMGHVYQNLGRYDRAAPLLEQALTLRQALHGPGHEDVAASLNRLGRLRRIQGDYAAAESLLTRALTLRRTLLGPTHEDVAVSMQDLATLYERQGHYAVAESLYRETLTLRQQLFGNAHEIVAVNTNSLAVLLWNKGDYEAAEPLLRRTLALFRKLFGDIHPHVTSSMNNLALVLADQKDYAAAESLFRQVLTLEVQLKGDTHPDVGLTLNNLASVLMDVQAYEEAEPLQQQALEISRARHGNEHRMTIINLRNLAELRRLQSNYAGADSLYREGLAYARAALGDTHTLVALCLVGVARIHLEREEHRDAEALLHEARAIQQALLPEGHRRTIQTESLLGRSLLRQGRHAEAEPLLRVSYPLLKDAYGEAHLATQAALDDLIALYEAVGNLDEATAYRKLRQPLPPSRP